MKSLAKSVWLQDGGVLKAGRHNAGGVFTTDATAGSDHGTPKICFDSESTIPPAQDISSFEGDRLHESTSSALCHTYDAVGVNHLHYPSWHG